MVSASAAMSGPSMRRAKRSKARPITASGVQRASASPPGACPAGGSRTPRARSARRCEPPLAAVLDQERHRELRVVGRREGDEERVVAVLLARCLLLVVLLALLHADHLRGAGLAGDGVAGAPAPALRRGAAGLRHVDHRGAHELEVLGLDRDRPRRCAMRARASPASSSPAPPSAAADAPATPPLASVAVTAASCSGVASM